MMVMSFYILLIGGAFAFVLDESRALREMRSKVVFIQTEIGSGSGVVVHPKGVIITNKHVIKDAEEISVTVRGKVYVAEIMYNFEGKDLAVIKIGDGIESFDFAVIRREEEVDLGDTTYVIGNPLGIRSFISKGIVSGFYTIDGVKVIMTDANMAPGNSGGAVFDKRGRLIAVATFTYLEGIFRRYSGLGGAISSEEFREQIGELR